MKVKVEALKDSSSNFINGGAFQNDIPQNLYDKSCKMIFDFIAYFEFSFLNAWKFIYDGCFTKLIFVSKYVSKMKIKE